MHLSAIFNTASLPVRCLTHKIIRVMNLTAVILLSTALIASAKGHSQTVTLNLRNAPIQKVFREIIHQTGTSIVYKEVFFKNTAPVTIKVRNATISDVLIKCLYGSPFTFRIEDNSIVIQKKQFSVTKLVMKPNTQVLPDISITGNVRDENGLALSNASILIKGSKKGVTTDNAGNFVIVVPDEKTILVISYTGYISQEITVGDRSSINVNLAKVDNSLEQVVVIGYGTAKKSDVAGSVATVSTSEFAEQPVTRVDQVLQGRASGVQVTSTGGAPGAEVRIRVRGANSITGDNDPLYVVDGFVGADFSTINPNDIESLQILKDAASTSIYGSRGANGVVIITTKKGSKGSIKISLNSSFDFSNVINKYDLLNASDFAETVNAKQAAIGLNPIFSDAQIAEFKASGGTDWQKEIFRRAYGQEHQISVSGGSDRTTYLVSANIFDQQGVIKNSNYNRYIVRSNINSQLRDNISLRFNITGSQFNNFNTNGVGGTQTPLTQAIAWAPTTPVYESPGIWSYLDPVGSIQPNPVALLYDQINKIVKNNVNVNSGINYEIVSGLSLDLQAAVNYVNRQSDIFWGIYRNRRNPVASRATSNQITLQNTNALNYKKRFNKHQIDAVVVFETQKFEDNIVTAGATGLTFPSLGYYNLSLANAQTANSMYVKSTLLSLLSRATYTFDSKYTVSASVRRDGSSKFQGDNKFSVFPSMALSWKAGDEAFIRNLNIFSNLRFRGSWGLTGSQAINPYATLTTYLTDAFAAVAFTNTSLTSGIMYGNPGNADLKWETTEQKNIGVQMGFLNNKLNVELDLFDKKTRDLLIGQPLPGYLGGIGANGPNSVLRNVGKIQNKGWDLSISVSPISYKNIKWTSNFNISNVKNTVLDIGGIADKLFTAYRSGSYSTQSEFVYMPGQPLGAMWGLKYLGTFKQADAALAAKYGMVPGDSRYEDLNGDFAIDGSDYQIIGSSLPKVTAGFNNTFSYKSLTLNVFFQGAFGLDKLNYNAAASMTGGGDARQTTLALIKGRYVNGKNENSDIPAFSKTNKTIAQSTRFLEDGSFVRMKNISLSFNLPKHFLSNIGNFKLFVTGTNLLTFTKYSGLDPESTSVVATNGTGSDINQGVDYGAYPGSKTYTFGLNVNFK